MIEAVISISFVVIAIAMLISIIYLSSFKTWMTHVAYEATICLAEDNPQNTCQKKVEKEIKLVNFFAYPVDIRTIRSEKHVGTKISIEFLPKQHLKVSQELPLPLKSREL